MRFIHAADIHLDSPLHGLDSYPDAPAAQLRGATREALVRLVDSAIDEAVDFMVIAGDLYDGDWRDYNTGIFFIGQMGRLQRAGIPVFLLLGNHDAESEMTKRLTLPDNVVRFGSRKAETHRLDHLRVALHGQSFRDKAVTDNLVLGYGPPVPGYFNIGVLHTALEGYAAHANYAPCTQAELHAKGYDYWALGHVHEFQHWSGPSQIVFPGNLQGRHIRETGRRGAVLVTVEDAPVAGQALGLGFDLATVPVRVERLFIDVLRWELLQVDASACSSMSDVARQVGAGLDALLAEDAQVPRAVRVVVAGESAAHGALFGKAAQLRAEVLAQMAVLGNERLWLEKLRVQTRAPVQGRAQGAGALAELDAILQEAAGSAEFLAQLQAELQPFLGKLSSELGEDGPLLASARAGDLAALVGQVSPGLLATLALDE